jgi:hypothetical protein
MIDLEHRSPLGETVAEFVETLPYEIDGDDEGF